MAKILIVDDHAVVRSGLRHFLAGSSHCSAVEEASNGTEALALVLAARWDLILLDLWLPDMNGLEVLKRIKHEQPALPVLIFSMHVEDDYAVAALEAGAAGFLPKDSPPEEILDAVRRACGGNRYLSPRLAEKLLTGSAIRAKKLPHDTLSTRETEVMRLLSQGVSLTQIGERLHLSPKTISTYRTRILEKLNVDSNAELTRYVLLHKLDPQ